MHRLAGPGFVRRTGAHAVVVVILTILAGCASAPEPPIPTLTSARDAIASAERSDAHQYAGAELDEAREKLRQAEGAVESEKMTEADHLAKQARIVAELAIARTAATKASQVNRQLRQDADALDEELKRTGYQQ